MYVKSFSVAPTKLQIFLYAWHPANWNCYVDYIIV